MATESAADRSGKCLLKLQQQNELVDQLRNENILTSTAFKVSQLALTNTMSVTILNSE